MCGESHGEHVRQWLYSHIAMLTEHQAISGSFMFLLCKNHPWGFVSSVFGKKNIRVYPRHLRSIKRKSVFNPRHPCSVKRKSVFISVIRGRQKENLLYFLHVSFFLFTFAPCLYALTGKTGYVCCVGGRHTEVPQASQDIMDWCCCSDRLVRQTAAAHQ